MTLFCLSTDEELVKVQDEPELAIALPQTFEQPALTTLQRGKLPHVEWMIARTFRASVEAPSLHVAKSNGQLPSLGPEYQILVNEFQPLFAWGMACWDYLLSTEGCRFVPRHPEDRAYYRGEYRAVTYQDYSRLLHRIFRRCVLEFAQTAVDQSFAVYLRSRFWDAVLGAYRQMEDPPDPRQRKLTAYSYLRCTPYRFLNAFHHDLVTRTLTQLPSDAREATSLYFLHFLTLPATAASLSVPEDITEAVLRRSLSHLLLEHRLVYCLLRQIERY